MVVNFILLSKFETLRVFLMAKSNWEGKEKQEKTNKFTIGCMTKYFSSQK